MKKAMTVTGLVNADKLGHILPHEHILLELPYFNIQPMYPELLNEKVTLSMLGKLRRQVWTCRDNCRLDEKQVAVEEISSFRNSGGGTLVDVTTIGLHRDVISIKAISVETGIKIVVGTGYYVASTHPSAVKVATIEELKLQMVSELADGIGETGIHAGIIGEIGISDPVHPDEEKVLRAAARAQISTNAPLSVHQFGGGAIATIDRILKEEGVDPGNVTICHMCSTSYDEQNWVANKGYYVSFDCFGNEFYNDAVAGKITRDPDRLRMVKSLVEKGYLRQVLVSNDISMKMLLKKYGGWSYEHIIKNIKPFMLRAGISTKAVDTILYYNPMRMITYL